MSDTIRESNGHFATGNPGGPGRPRKVVSRSAAALDERGAEIGQQIFQLLVDKAMGGDMRAIEVLLSRVWPKRRGRPLDIEARSITTLSDIVPASGDIANAVLGGEMTPDEGRAVSALFQLQCRTIEVADIDRRIRALEADIDRDNREKASFAPYSADAATVFDGFPGGSDGEKP